MTDLGIVSKSNNVKYYVHFSRLVAHKQFTNNAFDNYDIIFANGEYGSKN